MSSLIMITSEMEIRHETDTWRLFVRVLVRAARLTPDARQAVTAAMTVTRALNTAALTEGGSHGTP